MPVPHHHQLARRALPTHPPAATPVPVPVPVPGAPIVLYPGENPNDLNGAPFTTLPASLLSSIPPVATPTPRPTAPAATTTTTIPPTPNTTPSFATLTSARQTTPTPSPSSNPTPNNDTPSSSDGSPTTVGIVVSIIILVLIGVVGYALYRFHLRKKLRQKNDPLKLRPLVAGKIISRPILSTPTGSHAALNEKSDSFRRTRGSFNGNKKYLNHLPYNTNSAAPSSQLAPPRPRSAEKTAHRDTPSVYTYQGADVIDAYGSDISYPSTYAPQDSRPNHDCPIFRPSPAQIPRVHNVPGNYSNPHTPSELTKNYSSLAPSTSDHHHHPATPQRRLHHIPFVLPPVPTRVRRSERASYAQV